MRTRRIGNLLALAGLLVFVLAALTFLACGGDEEEEATPSPAVTAPAATPSPAATAPVATPTTGVTPAQTPQPESASVTIRDFEFDPPTVTIGAGGTVTWTNEGPSVHTVTADDGSFGSGNLSSGGTFSQTFNEPGTYDYHCTPHPFMTAQVIVE
jgi:amicyanin